jgi:enoyl-CoA hydratase/carnithine racemase
MQILAHAADGQRAADRLRRPMILARSIPKPVIAAINRACAGIGMIQACGADIRFAARGDKMAASFSRRSLPAENRGDRGGHGLADIRSQIPSRKRLLPSGW